jgi:wyosine [tRNA(Phe)-imidazoG37] synthetase (radical SAM superfamily)
MNERVFGPVPSRRLGQSLGINNVPAKTCTYSCVYCQLGAAPRQLDRRAFYKPEDIAAAVADAVAASSGKIDYLTFVPDGEPTLDGGIGEIIQLLRPLEVPIAVITNGSLLWERDVREALSQADWVSIKIDAVSWSVWQRMNRPHSSLDFEDIRQGWQQFADAYGGTLTTETMLVKNVNDDIEELRDIAACIELLKPTTAYLAVPTRPPACSWVTSPAAKQRALAYDIFTSHQVSVEELTGYSPDSFSGGEDIVMRIRSILAVHPMREHEVEQLLADSHADWDVFEELQDAGEIEMVQYQGHRFYVRVLPGVTRGDDDG